MATRFTIDGSEELEDRLGRICGQVGRAVHDRLAKKGFLAVILGGGYGRGEGGVLRTEAGDRPYNDLDFYIFVQRGWFRQRDQRRLHDLGKDLSLEAGVDIELKIECLDRWKKSPISMFSYDLACGYRVICGSQSILENCAPHRDASRIPLAEATRLLFNRCCGLLLVREILQESLLGSDQADFVGRNLAKMQLALGDAVLTACGQYHWSARERYRRLASFAPAESFPRLPEVLQEHEQGLEFKLHPRRGSRTMAEFSLEQRRLTELALQVWLWLESRRLQKPFQDASDYACSGVDKCPGGPAWRNLLLSLRTFGLTAALHPLSWQYPRGRLFHALSLLLWDAENLAQPRLLKRVQQNLHTNAPDWSSLLHVFKRIWPHYG